MSSVSSGYAGDMKGQPSMAERDYLAFTPGIVYIVYGECRRTHTYAYKIGMTTRNAQARISASKSEVWAFQYNLRVIHEISVDNARVGGMMFHQRFHDRRIVNGRHNQSEHHSE
jgi:hypothetical protein